MKSGSAIGNADTALPLVPTSGMARLGPLENLVHNSGLSLFFCPPVDEQKVAFGLHSNNVIAPRAWDTEDFVALVEGAITELAADAKTMCLGRVFYNNPVSALATQLLVQPGFVQVPRPLQPNSIHYLVIEWVECLCPDGKVIGGEILMEYLHGTCEWSNVLILMNMRVL